MWFGTFLLESREFHSHSFDKQWLRKHSIPCLLLPRVVGSLPKQAWGDTDELLFKGMARVQMSDRGDNWNERWQGALSLPNVTILDKSQR